MWCMRELNPEGYYTGSILPNSCQASVVKRANRCIAGAGWPSEEHLVNHLCQVIATDLISVAGHSL